MLLLVVWFGLGLVGDCVVLGVGVEEEVIVGAWYGVVPCSIVTGTLVVINATINAAQRSMFQGLSLALIRLD